MSNYGLGQYGQGEYGRYDADPVVPGVQTPRPPADIRVRAYEPNGDTVGLIPTPTGIGAQFALNDAGALSVEYPLSAPRASLLGRPLELALEVTWDGGETWNEPPSARFQYLRDEGDQTKPAEAYKIAAPGIIKRLEKAFVGFNVLGEDGRRTFAQETPGAILAAVWDTAQARGLLVGMTRSWTPTNDSNGTPWPEGQSISYEPGTNLLAIITGMAEQGWIDFRTQGRSVQAFVPDSPDGMGKDQTLGALPVTLRYGRDLTEAPFRRTWEGLADTALVLGDGGAFVTRTNPAAIKPWGPQETFATASGVSDPGTLNAIGDSTLEATEAERVEHTLGLEFATTPNLPFRDYLPGHWVFASVDSTQAPSRMRLRAVTVTRDSAGNMGGNVTLNDKFLEGDILQARRLQKIINGAVQAGTGTTPGGIGPDILAPAKVTGLVASSVAYVELDGRVRAQITLNWADTVTNADGSPASDVNHYEVWARVPGFGEWARVADTTDSAWFNSPYEPGLVWEFMVRAVDNSDNRGAFSDTATTTTAADLVPPPKPSTPTGTTRLGTARISWDGLTATGTDMAATVPDFRYVSVHVGTVNGFTPDDTNRVGELSAPGYVVAGPLNYQTTYYARLVAYDSSGNASTVSNQVTLVVAPLVDVSNFPDDAMEVLYARTGHFIDVTADMLQANSVTAMAVEAGAITAEKLSIGSAGVSIAVNGNMEDLKDDGMPVAWRLAYQNGGAAAHGVETASPISGARSLRLGAVPTDAGHTWHNEAPSPGYFPVVAGQVWFLRMTFRASRTLPSGKVGIRFHTSKAPSGPMGIFDPNVVWQGADGALTANTARTIEGQFTVPADHTRMLPGFFANGDAGGAYDLVIDNVDLWPATSDSQITEVSAGKIKTGIVQATERIVAGSLTGARAELNGVGFQGFNPFGAKMFEVQANSGDTFIGDNSGVHIKMGAYGNPYGQAYSQGLLEFNYTGSGWGSGRILGQYFTDSGQNWGAIRISSPYAGAAGNAAYLDLRNRGDGFAQFFLEADEAFMSANSFILGSGDGNTTVDFRLFGAPGFTFTDYSALSRLNVRPNYQGFGTYSLRASDNNGAGIQLWLEGNQVVMNVGGKPLATIPWFNRVWTGRYNETYGIAWGSPDGSRSTWLSVRDAAGNIGPIEASQFSVVSDVRTKAKVKDTPRGSLEKVRAMRVRDYDLDTREHAVDGGSRERHTGLVAQELAEVAPGLVYQPDTEDGMHAIDLYGLLATALAAIQELSERVDSLTSPKKETK